MKKSWHKIFMCENEMSMHENGISIPENEILPHNIFMDKNSMHEIVHSQILGRMNHHRKFLG